MQGRSSLCTGTEQPMGSTKSPVFGYLLCLTEGMERASQSARRGKCASSVRGRESRTEESPGSCSQLLSGREALGHWKLGVRRNDE